MIQAQADAKPAQDSTSPTMPPEGVPETLQILGQRFAGQGAKECPGA